MKFKFNMLSIILILVFSLCVFAESTENRYYMGNTINTGKDNGYSGSKAIEEKDVHWNWKIGDFYVSGFSQVIEGKTPVCLKTVGDEVTLNFELKQNISKLNNDASLIICEDTNGYDKYFQIEKTNFGKGVLILRHTDSQNYRHEPTIYTNYLSAKKSSKANTNVIFLEEGDYEVALNYEIKSSPINLFGLSVFPTYENYRIFFKFSVRNGNCMVFPYDVKTKSELVNSSFTENGFYLDLAKSKYLDIDIKKEILTEGVDGLVEDTRFNKPAKDGEEFTDEGIYTITASNKYTGQQTVKKIYVGTNKVLQAHTVTGLPISEISNQISLGAEISSDGSIIYPEAVTASSNQGETKENTGNNSSFIIVFAVIIAVICGAIVFIRLKKGTHEDGGADK